MEEQALEGERRNNANDPNRNLETSNIMIYYEYFDVPSTGRCFEYVIDQTGLRTKYCIQ